MVSRTGGLGASLQPILLRQAASCLGVAPTLLMAPLPGIATIAATHRTACHTWPGATPGASGCCRWRSGC